MNPKTVVILLVLLILAGAGLVLTRPGAEPATEPAQTNDAQLIPSQVLSNTLNAIDLGPEGFGDRASSSMSLAVVRGQWQVHYPDLFPAELRPIDDLLALLAGLRGQATDKHYHKAPPITAEERVGVEGVIQADPPAIVLHNDGGKALEVTLGPRLGAGKAALFVESSDGDAVTYHTTDALHDFFESFDPDLYYADAFDPPLMPEVSRIEITTPEGTSTLVQDNKGWWIETDKGRERALEQGIAGYSGINNYFNLFDAAELIEKQTHYPANGMASFGLKNPLISMRFVPMGQDANEPTNGYEIHVGTPADAQDQTRYISNGYAGQATHPVFTIDSKLAVAFAQDANTFRDPRIIVTPSTLIASIGLKFGEGTSEAIELFSGQPPTFRRFNGEQRSIPTQHATDLLKALSEARASAYVPINLSKWDKWVSVVITPRLEGKPELLAVYDDPLSDADQPTMLVHRANEPVALRVPKASVAGLIDPESLLEPPR